MNTTDFLWDGRFDGHEDAHKRFFQIVNQQPHADFTLLGFASDEGVRRNKGRLGAVNGVRPYSSATCESARASSLFTQ